MANPEHLAILNQGVEAWNRWREEHPEIQPDLAEADLSKSKLYKTNLSGASLQQAYLLDAFLMDACLNKAKANLRGVTLLCARLDEKNFEKENLEGCVVYGISAWRVKLTGAKQSNLIITHYDEPVITLDSLEVAQFVYLLLNNERIRHVIDTITSKVVLILGRFTPERKAILDAIREELRRRDYLPVLFDFEKPASRDLTETISTLAHMARFVIADLTDAKSIPQELQRIVPDLPSVPIQPLLHTAATEYGMFEHFKRYPWVLEVFHYDSVEDILNALHAKVIGPAEAKAKASLGTG
jgi:hypothetical protein